MAIDLRSGRIVGAGREQAEYQGWLCPGALADSFPAKALGAIQTQLPGRSIGLRYLPPGTPTAWLAKSSLRHRCVATQHRRPLMRLGDGSDIEQSLRKNNNKSRLRKLRKLGTVELVRLTDHRAIEAFFDEFARFHDARHLAAHDVKPFATDPNKKVFWLELAKRPGLLHTTFLKAGDSLVAAHFGFAGGSETTLNLFAHNPLMEESSPGKLLVLLLSKMLCAEGCQTLDLTPGDDPYKERFANDFDHVFELEVLPGIASRHGAAIRGWVKQTVKSALLSARIKPIDARRRFRQFLPHVAIPALLKRVTGVWAPARPGQALSLNDP